MRRGDRACLEGVAEPPRHVLVVIGSRQAATAAAEAAVAAADPRGSMTLLAVAAPPSVFARQYVAVHALRADILRDLNRWLATALEALPPTAAVKALTALDRPVRAVRRLVESADFDLVVWSRRPGLAGSCDARAAAALRKCGVPAILVPPREGELMVTGTTHASAPLGVDGWRA